MSLFSQCVWSVPGCNISRQDFGRGVLKLVAYTGIFTSAWVFAQYLSSPQGSPAIAYAAAIGPVGSCLAYGLKKMTELDQACGFDDSAPSETFCGKRVLPFLGHLFFLSTMSFVTAIALSVLNSWDLPGPVTRELAKGFGIAAAMLAPVVILIGTLSYFSCFKKCADRVRPKSLSIQSLTQPLTHQDLSCQTSVPVTNSMLNRSAQEPASASLTSASA